MGMKRALTTSYHPQADGQTEAMNQTLEIILRAYVGPERNDWAEKLDAIALAYNSSVQTATGRSPAFLLYGYHPITASKLRTKNVDNIERPGPMREPRGNRLDSRQSGLDIEEFRDEKAQEMIEAFEAEQHQAQEALHLGQLFQQKYYNQGRLSVQFEEGDKVFINPHTLRILRKEKGVEDISSAQESRMLGKKFLMRYDRPFEILSKISPVAYQIRLPMSYKMHPVINIEHLEPYSESPPEFGNRPRKRLNREDFEALPEVEVEKIVDESYRYLKTKDKRRRRYPIYRVHFVGYPPEEDDWKTEGELRNAPEILREWKIQWTKCR